MNSSEHLLARVNAELVLDAGECQHMEGETLARLVRPPATTLFWQVIEFLRAQPDPEKRSAGGGALQGVAAAAVTLRWGSYFCVLADRSKPLWDAMNSPSVSRISDGEMARINIEASAAMAAWIDLYRADPLAHARLAERAVAHLPMAVDASTSATRARAGALRELSDPQYARHLVRAAEEVWGAEYVSRARGAAERHPTRVLANALVNVTWRNGPVEDIHAGHAQDYPLDRRRITPSEESALMGFTSDGLALAMQVCRQLANERSRRAWSEQVLPYALGTAMGVTPTGWTLTETSREVSFQKIDTTPAGGR